MNTVKTSAVIGALVSLLSAISPASADRIVSGDFDQGKTWMEKRNLDLTDSPQEALTDGYILVVGQGLPMAGGSPARQKLTAIRAAEITAYRRLAEIINGVYVSGQTTVRDCSLESEVVKTAVSGLIKGARKVHEEWNPVDGTAVVFMQIGVRGADGVAEAMYNNYINAAPGRALLKAVAYTLPSPMPVAAAPAAAPVATAAAPIEPHDGLIIDARELGFQPALINRIFSSKGEALYDPSKVSQKILVEQGAGEYTNTVEKARAALEARGAKMPMVVKATGLKTMADLNVSDEDVMRIFLADQKSNFLASAKVAFVLK
ncbi:MAG: hypothetical protein B7Y41_13890 [Hydrogenophilales bacterium 28-61-23]|nr:MAG: hypothetical protein B7Y41_13890 [Hydrogenophilales bacterium 28-61-23]